MDNDGVCKRFILVDDEYKFFFDHHLSGGDNNNSFLPPFDDDSGESETRNLSLEFASGDSKRSKLGGAEKRPIENRVSQKRKRETVGSEAEVSRATTRESIQRDNRAAERRKRKMAEFESATVSRNQETFQRDNKGKKVSESTKVNTSLDVPLVRAQETIQRDNKAKKMSESKVDTLRNVPLFRATQRDNKCKKVSESTKVNTLKDVPLVRAQETIQRDIKAKKMSESTKVDTLRDVPLFRTKEAIRRDNRIAEGRKKKTDETKAAGTTSRVVHVERVNSAVDKTPKFVPVTQNNKGVSVGNRKKSVVDKDYMSYLTWLVDSLKDSTTVPSPTPPTQYQSTMPPEKDIESCSDDDDMIMISDSPFSGGDSTTPFVVSRSKTVIDLEKDSTEDESIISSVFTKELMDELEKPYDEGELLRLSGDVSVKKQVSRCRELRKGRVSNYESHELGLSYLEKVSDFDREYRRADGDDKARLKLLRGFFFYLKNVTRDGSFKPWLPENQKKLGIRKQCLQP